MPIWLRRITFKFTQDSIDQEEKNKNNTSGNNNPGKTTLDWVNPDRSKF
jgi:hypothetical protein